MSSAANSAESSAGENGAEHVATPAALPGQEKPPADKPSQFSIATLLLATTIIGVCLGLFRISPVLGVASLALVVPAVIRTTLLARREKFFGGKLSAAEKVAVFLGSLVVAFLCLGATLIAGGAACAVCILGGGAVSLLIGELDQPAYNSAPALIGMLAFVATLLAGAYTAWKTFVVTWPPRDDFVRQLHRGDIVHIPQKGPTANREPMSDCTRS